ncbi:XRE family transcriptional regulator [archaeon]|nr:MAG: XRE family transcriptional regulator [archaeon]
MDSLGQRLQHFRLESGWSKRALAEKLGVSIPSIIRWEAEIAVPNDYNRYKIEQFLSASARSQPQLIPTHRPSIEPLGLFSDREGKIRQVQ